MVASPSHELYSSLQRSLHPDEGARSSGESSGFHSPTQFGASFSSPQGDSFPYHDQLEVQRSSAIVVPQYDYSTSSPAQQTPLLDVPLQISGSGAHPLSYQDYYPVALDEIPQEYPVQHFSQSRLPYRHIGVPLDPRYPAGSERRLPGRPSHDSSPPSHTRSSPLFPTESDRKHPMSSSSEVKEPSKTKTSTRGVGSRESRKEVSTVVIACRQCRGRKIRCDSTRPVCNNCVRRSNVCEYDPVPKRRGPDKNPGTRHRRCKKRPPDEDDSVAPPPKRKRTATDHTSINIVTVPSPSKTKENMASDRPSSSSSASAGHFERGNTAQPRSQERLQHPSSIELRIATPNVPNIVDYDHSPTTRRPHPYAFENPYIKASYPRPLDVNVMRSPHTQHQKLRVPASPSVKQTQKMWWDTFLKDWSLTQLEQDFKYLFTDTGHWLSFLNIDYFVKTLMDEEARLSIQPALIYAGLAMSTLMHSSEVEFKAPGRERALWYRDTAETFIQSSINSEWIDPSLAEAALILALFESSAHPMYNPDRVERALLTLDFIIRTTSLSTLDSTDPDVITYPAGCVPMIDLADDSPDKKCTCIPPDSTQSPSEYSTWSYIPPWDPNWSDTEIRDEECRRLCWSALSMMCNYVSQCVAFNRDPPDFFLLDSANYALLFPGEVVDRVSPAFRSSTASTKESVWALYCRGMLLWSFTNRLRITTMPNDEKVELIYDAWSEAQSLQNSLRSHRCNLDTALIYRAREYVYNTQITITQTLRSLHGLGIGPPIFKRKQAEDWLYYQDRVFQIVRGAVTHLGGPQGYQLTRRPYQATWFANQLSICLLLWDYDRSLRNALVLAKSILVPVEMMTSLWPCAVLQNQSDDLRKRLVEACTAEGIEPPLPTNFTLPSL